MKKIVLTGGGTAGHVTPNIALIPALKEAGYEISYIGSYDGIEKKLIEEQGIPYYGISSGKFRRDKSPKSIAKNLTDPARIIKGLSQARRLLAQIGPDIVFSKGGYVSVPVVIAADRAHIPVIIHESDMTPGLANRLSLPHAVKVCTNFPETAAMISGDKGILTGCPIRAELLTGDRATGLAYAGLSGTKPVLMIIGGSLGALHVNEAIRRILPALTERYEIIHICGKGKTDEAAKDIPGYIQFEYVGPELKDLFAAADLVVSRAGANVICELLAMKKPNLLIPLPAAASRGDQILNANSFKSQGYSMVLEEENMNDETLLAAINALYENRGDYIHAMDGSVLKDATQTIVSLIGEYSAD